jgi:DNA invertase Pin-like site-specific DNA recombinase
MTTYALLIPRVSSKQQEADNQLPELERYCDGRGYAVGHVEYIRGLSAFHGRHRAQILKAVREHVTQGQCDVVLFRHADRMSREEVETALDFYLTIRKSGARVEFALQPELAEHPELLGLYLRGAHAESVVRADRTRQGVAARKAAGKAVGRPPFGYQISKGVMTLTDTGRVVLPDLFKWASEGVSTRQIAARLLRQHGVTVSVATVRRIVQNPAYIGERVGTDQRYEVIIDRDLFERANKVISGNSNGGGGARFRTLELYCGACFGRERPGAPDGMSKMNVWTFKRRNGDLEYYRCSGSGSHRGSCGARFVPVEELWTTLDEMMRDDFTPYRERHWVTGGTGERTRLQRDMQRAMNAARYTDVQRLAAELAALPSDTAGHWEWTQHGTVGERWTAGDRTVREAILADYELTAVRVTDAGGTFVRVGAIHRSLIPDAQEATE